MDYEKIKLLKKRFYDGLVYDTLPFWTQNAIDKEQGGYFTLLDRKGEPLSPHKGMWVHGRFIWLLSRLYNELEPRKEWLELAGHGVDFVKKHGFDSSGRMYFELCRDGSPLRMRRYLFTEIFAVIGFAEYYRATGEKEALIIARRTMDLIHDLLKKPGALEPKYNPEVCSYRDHSMAMIQINTLQILRDADPDTDYTCMIDKAIDEVFTYFVKPEHKALLENVGMEGEIIDTPEGRCINPGHSIETAWFLLEEGKLRGDKTLIKKALDILDWSLNWGWDEDYGGLFSFVDLKGRQPVQVEWDMKYWWPHNESIYALLLAFSITGSQKYLDWFEKILEWSELHFPDREDGEWFGYLRRDGSVSSEIKGNGWKGPFHLPRQQLYCYLLLKEMEKAAIKGLG